MKTQLTREHIISKLKLKSNIFVNFLIFTITFLGDALIFISYLNSKNVNVKNTIITSILVLIIFVVFVCGIGLKGLIESIYLLSLIQKNKIVIERDKVIDKIIINHSASDRTYCKIVLEYNEVKINYSESKYFNINDICYVIKVGKKKLIEKVNKVDISDELLACVSSQLEGRTKLKIEDYEIEE